MIHDEPTAVPRRSGLVGRRRHLPWPGRFLPQNLTANAPGIDQEITISHEVPKKAVDASETLLAATTSGYWNFGSHPLAGVVMESDSSGTSPPEGMASSDERFWGARGALVETSP